MKRVFIIAMAVVWFSCEPRQGQQVTDVPPKASKSLSEFVAKEVLQVSNYTYVRGTQGGNEIWVALPKREVEIGKTYYFKPEMKMEDFESKDLERTFESIYFLSALYDNSEGKKQLTGKVPEDEFHSKRQTEQKENLSIEPTEGVTTINDLYAQKETFNNKKVKVKGVVTKYNPGIMDRNWVHIQDGTGGESSFDLTITTQDITALGSVVSFEGIVAIDKDFGHGYKYELILESAVLLNKQPEVKVN